MASSNSQRRIEQVHADLRDKPRTWLVTGAAGFIGSHLVENLLQLGQTVTGMDDYSTGQPRNLAEVQALVTPAQWARFEFIEGDIRDLAMCTRACARKEFVLHHAALGSVPLSIADPLRTHTVNVQGTLHILQAARDCGVRRVVYASSSAVYGDQPGESMREDLLGRPLSPYAASKWMNEIDAEVFGRCYAL
ncbi:MAG: UDP-N-acetylglucosamine/UDP-N-acetylgalactosamine 4-epimerase, partial [Verrucomicrobiota bacterium]